MESRRDVFQAIADPTRREIINMITRESLNLNSIAEKFDSLELYLNKLQKNKKNAKKRK